MARKKRPFWLLLFGIVMLLGLGYFLYSYSPKSIFPSPVPFSITPVYLFFVLVFLTLSSLTAYIGRSLRRGIFFALFICAYLLLRLNHFTEMYFALILLALYVSLELFFTRYH